MRSIKQFIVLMFCLFVGTSMLLVAGISAADENYYYSGKGNNLNNYMYMELDVQDNDTVFLSFSTKYDIEETGDNYATPFIIWDLNIPGIGLYKIKGTQTDWTIESCDFSSLSSFVNESFFAIGFLYYTDDSGTIKDGFYVDNIEISVNGETIFTDDGTNESWTLVGFTRVSETGDTTPPVIDQPLDIWIEQNATGDITWIVTETNPDKYWVLRDGSEVVSPKSYENGEEIKVPIDTSAKGTYDYTIYANDTSGKNASDLVNITVNTTLPPTIDIKFPASGYSTESESVTISGVVDGTGSIPTVTVNEKPAEFTPTGVYSGTFSVSVPLSMGDNQINAIATDAAGMKEYDEIIVNRYKKSSGGGGGGGGGTSGEDFGNILVSETEREYVNKDSKVSYSFDMEGNIVRYINFTGKTSSGRIVAKIDILKNTSTLVDQAPPGKVFKNMGIYVGNLGWANPNNIADPTISFYVDKSWVTEYNIDISTIRLNRYSDGKWNPLETDLTDEDQDSLYFESKTPGFSQFAVTGTEASAEQDSVEDVVVKPTIVVEIKEPVTEQTPDEKDTGIPGFTLLSGIIIMLVVVKLLRR